MGVNAELQRSRGAVYLDRMFCVALRVHRLPVALGPGGRLLEAVEAYNRARGWTAEGWLGEELLAELGLSEFGSASNSGKLPPGQN